VAIWVGGYNPAIARVLASGVVVSMFLAAGLCTERWLARRLVRGPTRLQRCGQTASVGRRRSGRSAATAASRGSELEPALDGFSSSAPRRVSRFISRAMTVCMVRDYGMTDRAQAPADSRCVFDEDSPLL
jgi:hypothetical protein